MTGIVSIHNHCSFPFDIYVLFWLANVIFIRFRQLKRFLYLCGFSYNLMKYCWMWSFKDRPTYSAIIKLLVSSCDLAATEALPSRGRVEPAHYNEIAGIHTHTGEAPTADSIKNELSVC